MQCIIRGKPFFSFINHVLFMGSKNQLCRRSGDRNKTRCRTTRRADRILRRGFVVVEQRFAGDTAEARRTGSKETGGGGKGIPWWSSDGWR
jgi:hypothetical protein